MDYDHAKNPSILGGHEDKFLNNKMLSRNSLSCSSRIYYHGSTQGVVPFKWEMQPGTPKNGPVEEALPPLSPPPAVLALGLPKPCFDHVQEPADHKKSCRTKLMKLRFWKKRNNKILKNKEEVCYKSNEVGSDKFVNNFDGFSSDVGEFMASPPRNSTSSSSSSSSSFYDDHSLPSSGSHSVKDWSDGGFSCSPWILKGIVISVAKRG